MAIEYFPQANPVLQKIAAKLNLSGSGPENPILSGLAATMTINLSDGETLDTLRIYSGDPDSPTFEQVFEVSTDGEPTTNNVVFGTDTDTGASAVRNYIEWVTDRGKTTRQFYVQNLPSQGCLYINNQEAQGGDAVFQIESGDPVSFGINILPNLADEFFKLGEYSSNRYANTLRSWGGAFTGQVSLDGTNIISERYLGDIHGYYWPAPSSGNHPIAVRVRAATASAYYVDITGNIRIEYL
jgi:hypothetical protein